MFRPTGTQQTSFGTGGPALLGDRALHEQHRERDHEGQHSRHPKCVEISKRRRLLLTQVFELLHSQLLRGHWIAGLLNEERLSPREKVVAGWVEGTQIFPKPQNVKLVSPLLEGLGQRHADAAALVPQELNMPMAAPRNASGV